MTRTAHSPFVFVWFGLVLIASVGLYRTSDRVRHLDLELRQINANIESEHQRLHVLKTEWTYLSNPVRLEAAARKHLALRPTSLGQITSLDRAASVLSASLREASAAAKATAPAPARRPRAMAVASSSSVERLEPTAPENAKPQPPDAEARQATKLTASVQPMPDSLNALLDRLEAHP